MKKITFALLLFVALSLSSCKKDPAIPNEEELITTLIYTLTPSTGGAPVVFKFEDLDGDGGAAPVISQGVLQANTTYNAAIQLLNETVTPSDNIGAEVLAEGTDHQFIYAIDNSALLNINATDADANGNPIGIETTVNTLAVGTAALTISLKHKPKKPNDNTTADAGGETDIEVQFDVDVQ